MSCDIDKLLLKHQKLISQLVWRKYPYVKLSKKERLEFQKRRQEEARIRKERMSKVKPKHLEIAEELLNQEDQEEIAMILAEHFPLP